MANKRDELVEKYAIHIRDKFGETPDTEFLYSVTVALGPSIYNRDSATVSSSDESELERVKNNFLIKKLGMTDSPELMEAIHKVMSVYGASVRTKYRAVVYYMLARHFKKEGVYS